MRHLLNLPTLLAGACLSLAPSSWAGELTDSPSYDWIAGGYFWANSGEDILSDPQGFALAGSWEAAPRVVLQAAYEHAKSKAEPGLLDLRFKDQAYIATIGTYFPLSERFHLTADVGIDYEVLSAKGTALSPADDDSVKDLLGNVVVGFKAKPTNRFEFGASLQRLHDFRDDGEGSWVGRVDTLYAISSEFDLGASFAYENNEPAILIGGRYRF